jgi:hypothetical protein
MSQTPDPPPPLTCIGLEAHDGGELTLLVGEGEDARTYALNPVMARNFGRTLVEYGEAALAIRRGEPPPAFWTERVG